MEYIDMRFIMNRLLDNPMLKSLKLSSAGTYVKDFASINGVSPIIGYRFSYVNIKEYHGDMPVYIGHIEDVYLCDPELIEPLFQNNRIGSSLKTSAIPRKDKKAFGLYTVRGNHIHTDIEEGVLEIYHSVMEVDDMGYPTLPYDGSLIEAVTNYIKYRYFTILWENDIIPKNKVDSAHIEYMWYIGQYTTNAIMPSHDEAVAWANSWQRLMRTKPIDADEQSFREVLNI